jgi:2-hydroxy-3-keto-5-methylthiopentenyl-1-phosphate phosphatase
VSNRSLVVDWDGTVTERDILEQVVLEFGDPGVYARTEAELGRTLTHDDVLAIEVGTVRAPLDEVVDFVVREARLRPGFRELARRRRPLVVSAGFHELIEPVLAREGIEVDLRANRVDARPDGWRVLFRETVLRCESCGEACKRLALPRGDVVFVGDGYSDRCAALAADRVFATDSLARYLDSVGAAYEPFADFHDVAAALAA